MASDFAPRSKAGWVGFLFGLFLFLSVAAGILAVAWLLIGAAFL